MPHAGIPGRRIQPGGWQLQPPRCARLGGGGFGVLDDGGRAGAMHAPCGNATWACPMCARPCLQETTTTNRAAATIDRGPAATTMVASSGRGASPPGSCHSCAGAKCCVLARPVCFCTAVTDSRPCRPVMTVLNPNRPMPLYVHVQAAAAPERGASQRPEARAAALGAVLLRPRSERAQ